MKNFVFATIAVALSIFGLATACSVSFPDDGEPGTFPCESDDDCIEGQECDTNENGNNVCQEPDKKDPCIDEDGDGYGTGESRTNCKACNKNWRNGCEKDCDDSNPQKHPGKFENCDGIDNDCDGMTDEPAGTEEGQCGGTSGCPLEVEAPQDGTQFGCESVDGTSQCVVKGSFSGADACKNVSGQTFGTCESGSWTDVPCECRTGDSGCGN